MNGSHVKDIDRRLRKLESEAVRLRKGIVTDDSPLSVTIGGSDIPFSDVSSVGPVADGDVVAVLSRDSGVIVLGTIGDGSASGGGPPSGAASGDLAGSYPSPTVPGLAGKQPLDSDLTAIAGLATTSYGRGLLTLANISAALTYLGAAATVHTHAQSDITGLVAALAAKAALASPAFTGNPTAPTQTAGDNSTRLATTAYADAIAALKANLASPTFTGDPKAPTPTAGDNDTSIATTAFVTGANATASAADRARANHTGTQLASTISNFDTQVRTSRLDQMATPTADLGMGLKRLTSLADGFSTNDAVNYGQLEDGVALAQLGFSFKAPCKRKVTGLSYYSRTGNVLTGSGTGYLSCDDGMPAQLGERVLIVSATSNADAGIYKVTVQGFPFGSPWELTREPDAVQGTLISGSYVTVISAGLDLSNPQAGDYYLATADPITVNMTLQDWVAYGPRAAEDRATGSFHAYRNSAFNIVRGSTTTIQWDTEEWDVDSWHDTATNKGRFTPQRPGYYTLGARYSSSADIAAGNFIQIWLQKNGSNVKEIAHAERTGFPARQRLGGEVTVEANGMTDYFTIGVYVSGSSTSLAMLTGSQFSYFYGQYIGSA